MSLWTADGQQITVTARDVWFGILRFFRPAAKLWEIIFMASISSLAYTQVLG
jgi:hypothetical protein